MKWIGQHIYDFISRFRSDVYLEDISDHGSDPDRFLTMDSATGKVTYRTGSEVLSDIGAGTGAVSFDGSTANGVLTYKDADEATVESNLTFSGTALALTGVMDISPANDAGASALIIDNDDVDQIALDIDAANTTANIIDVNAQALTTGSAVFIDCNSLNNGRAIKVDADDTATAARSNTLLDLSYDKSGVAGDGITHSAYGGVSSVRDLATNHANSTVNLIGHKVSVTSASTQGANTNTGLDITSINATSNVGIDLTVTDGGKDIVMYSTSSPDDYCYVGVGGYGATKISTVNGSVGGRANFEIEADGEIILDSAVDIYLEAAGNDVFVDTDNFILESSTESAPVLTIKSTHTTVNKQGQLQFVKDAADTEDNEGLGLISFYGEDEGNNQTLFAQIKSKIVESDEGSEGGKLLLGVASHDAEMINGIQIVDGNAEDEVDITIASGASSLTTIAGTLTMGSTAFVNNSGVIQVATQGTIDHDSLANFVANEHIDWTGSSAGTVHSSNIPTLNQDTTGNAATATNLVASTSTAVQLGTIELGHADDTTIARSASGVATIESNIIQTKNKVIHIEHANFTDDMGTTEHFIPFISTAEHTSFANEKVPMIMPVAGKLLKVHYKTNNHTNVSSNEVTFKLYDIDDGELWSDANKTVIGTKVVDGVARTAMCTADFQDLTTSGASGSNAFTAGELVGVSIQNSQAQGITTKYSVTLVFELDFNSY